MEKLPDIEAKTYPLRVIRRSNSNKIYLVEDPQDRKPELGRILLLKKEEEAILAFRVVKQYPDKHFLALKRVRKYGSNRYLDDGDTFTAVEKLGDLHPPPLTAQDRRDLGELEGENGLKPKPYDPDLDAGTTPPPKDEIIDEDDLTDTYTVEETHLLDLNNHWITGGFGYIRNAAPPAQGGSYYFSAGNLRYGVNVGKLVFVKAPKIQDSFTLESGIYFYKALGFVTLTDSYTLLSLFGAIRYNLITSRSFGFFFYLGLTQGVILSSTNADATALATLGSLLPAAGAGILFEVGPNWYTRVDIGLDSIGLNLVLRF